MHDILGDEDYYGSPFGQDSWYEKLDKLSRDKSNKKISDFDDALKKRGGRTPDWPEILRSTKTGYVPLFVYGSLKPQQERHNIIKHNSICISLSKTISDNWRIHRSLTLKGALAYRENSDKVQSELHKPSGKPISGFLYMVPCHKILDLDNEFKNGDHFQRELISIVAGNYDWQQLTPIKSYVYLPIESYWKPFKTTDTYSSLSVKGVSCCHYQ